jgi:hypothetical protein
MLSYNGCRLRAALLNRMAPDQQDRILIEALIDASNPQLAALSKSASMAQLVAVYCGTAARYWRNDADPWSFDVLAAPGAAIALPLLTFHTVPAPRQTED